MQLINETLNHDDQSMCNDDGDESQGDAEVKLACGCMLPDVAGAFSHEGERKLNAFLPERRRVVLEVLLVLRGVCVCGQKIGSV